MIHSVPYLTHNVINKYFDHGVPSCFDRLALLCKFIFHNSKAIPVLFQLNHISKYFQIKEIQLHHQPNTFPSHQVS